MVIYGNIDLTYRLYSLHYHHFIRSRNDCNIDAGVIGTDASFGIKCCPSDRTLDFTNQDECLWLAADTGEEVTCGEEQAAFGRCSTSARSGRGGDCNNVSFIFYASNCSLSVDISPG